MEIKILRNFIAVVQEEGVPAASDVLRISQPALSRQIKDLEEEMLETINKLGIGPQGFGGKTTALALNIETMPTHIAGMPCAVNINCHVTRHKTEVI